MKNLLVIYALGVKIFHTMPGLPRQCTISNRRFLSRLLSLMMLGWCGAGFAEEAPLTGPATINPNQIFQDGMTAFNLGDYKKAVASLESLIALAPEESQLEPAWYTLGASYFNLQQYPKSIEVLKKYLEKYPKSKRISQAVYSLARASMMNKDYTGAQGFFKQLEKDPKMREQVLFDEGMAFRAAGQTEEAIIAFEKLTGQEIITTRMANSAILLTELYVKKHDASKAVALLQRLQKNVALVDNVVRLNSLAVELGDSMIEEQKPDVALGCYRIVRTRDEVIKFQNDRIAAMQKKIDQNIEVMRAGVEVADSMTLLAENNQMRDAVAEDKNLLKGFQNLPDFQPALLLRIARCYYNMGKKWEAIVVYDTLLAKYPGAPEREPAMYSALVASAEVGRTRQTHRYCEEYMKLFPRGQSADTVGYLMGATALQANDFQAAETYFGRMLRERPGSSYREETEYLLGNVYFGQGKFDEANAMYEKCRKDFPDGQHFEEATYRIALCSIFTGKYEEAMRQVTDYLAKYPKGSFVADAKYRLAVCKYAASQEDEVIADCRAWLKQFNNDPMSGEVLALLADALDASGNSDEAIETYLRAYKAATTDEVMNYALFAAQKLLLKKGRWDRIGSMFQEFVKDKPDNPTVVTAMYWIGRAMVHEGNVDGAKQFFARTIKKYIDDKKRDGVEPLLTQLAQLCVRKKPATASASPTTGSSTTAASAPEPPPVSEDPGAELDSLLADPGAPQTQTAKARILFAKSELARMRKRPANQEKDLQAIADDFKPGDLSPTLLALTGDYLLGKGQNERAAVLFQMLMDDYPKSEMLDFAYNGLGEIAYQQQQFDKALKYFNGAVDQAGATLKLKEVTLGIAKTLLAMNRLGEAKKSFEQVASVREWRGDATACSVYSLGEIAQKQNNLPEAIANYQRVYVGYQRFLPWVAKAYVKSAECFEKLGKNQEAINTYREMLRNEKLASFPEAATARKRLQEAGQG